MAIETAFKSNSTSVLSTTELVTYLKNPASNEISIDRLYIEFHKRFKQRFFQKCLDCSVNAGFDESLANDIFQNSFIKLLKKLPDFEIAEDLSVAHVENKLVAWFGKTASRELINYLRKYKIDSPLTEEIEEFKSDHEAEYDEEIIVQEDVTTVKYKLRQAMISLTERERFILLIAAHYGCLGNNKHLPDDVRQDICKYYSIKQNNIKTIQSRAFKKVKALLSQNSSN